MTELDFTDPFICDNAGCTNPTTQKCSRCKLRVFCCRQCQVTAWHAVHKKECPRLKACHQVSQVSQSVAEFDGKEAVSMAIVTTQSHGRHFVVMEKFQQLGPESNRQVVQASTTDLDETGILNCIMDSILFPEYDGDVGGRRRPYYVEIFRDTFPDASLVDAICTLLVRLGVHLLEEDAEASGHEWNTSWFLVQKGWNDEINDPLFSALIQPERQVPMPPNGTARKELSNSIDYTKAVPWLDPADFPTREQALQFPFTTTGTELCVVAKAGVVYTIVKRGPGARFSLRQQVRLQKRTLRPYPEDVFLLIYKVIVEDLKERPSLIMVGQPSVSELAEVDPYEKALDMSISQGWMMLPQCGYLEGILDNMLRGGG